MLLLFLSGASLLALVNAQYSCSSVGSMTHTMNGCPVNEGFPDCSYIQANSAAICSTLLTSWEIVNGQACNLRGASYGCIYATGQYSTTDEFCCPLVLSGGAAVTVSSTASSSVTATASASSSASATATATSSASASDTASATATASSSASASATATATATATSTSSETATSTSTSTSTETLTSTPTVSTTSTPSHINTTIITVIKTETTPVFMDGVAAAIGLSAIFGFSVLVIFCYCCVMCVLRRRLDTNIHKLPDQERRLSIAADRRPSQVGTERRKSQVQTTLSPKSSV